MATRSYSKDLSKIATEHSILHTWTGLLADDDGQVVEMCTYADRTIQITGTFSTGTLLWEGSLDASNYATLNDPQGNPLSITSAKIETVMELTRYARPRVSGGDGSTDLTVTLLARRTL